MSLLTEHVPHKRSPLKPGVLHFCLIKFKNQIKTNCLVTEQQGLCWADGVSAATLWCVLIKRKKWFWCWKRSNHSNRAAFIMDSRLQCIKYIRVCHLHKYVNNVCVVCQKRASVYGTQANSNCSCWNANLMMEKCNLTLCDLDIWL